MSLRMILALSAALIATPALAQTPPPAAEAAAPPIIAPVRSPEEVAMEAKGQAFQVTMDTMGRELEAVMTDAAKDNAAKSSEANAIVDRHSPAIASFANDLEAFIRAMADKPENADRRDEILSGAGGAPAAIRGIPDQVRASIAQALEAAPAAPAPAQ